MPTPSLRREVALETVERVNEKLKLGFRPMGFTGTGNGAVREAAEQAVSERWINTVSAFHTRLRIARSLYGLEPDESAYRPRQYLHAPPGLPAVAVQDHIKEPLPEGKPIVVCVIGDAHDSPHLADKERFPA